MPGSAATSAAAIRSPAGVSSVRSTAWAPGHSRITSQLMSASVSTNGMR